MGRFAYLKGHATLNDFIVVDDQHGMRHLDVGLVARLCDRRAGIGADGVLRVVRAQHIEEWDGDPDLWFMDYRNADGSIAEMCGNGLRLFARHLMNEQLVGMGDFQVATRAGVKQVRPARGDNVSVNLGTPVVAGRTVTVRHGDEQWQAHPVDVGNPHVVSFVGADELASLDLDRAPGWVPADSFPHGVNAEFVCEESPGVLRMRVHERGSGETMSCGTGVVASAAAYRAGAGYQGTRVEVHTPGGTLSVDFADDGAWLTGPAVITGRGEYWG